MHPKLSSVLIGAIVVLGLIGLLFSRGKTPEMQIPVNAEDLVRAQVVGFGNNLKMVPLLAGTSTVDRAMDQNYASYIAPELLSLWKDDPSIAPGRLTSSPWPERIDVTSVLNINNVYTVHGQVIEKTSSDQDGGYSGSYPVTLTLENRNNGWLITKFSGYPPSLQ